ncbi:hypothetical protein [Vreelandella songnenensis]|uniref:hypothetical protein n=1 Tax=Vreelandella songnenensis TaxID=1176243 RepID=UPI001ABF742E|nr:hypothetical protein [Halomonas songnenensis]
MERSFHQVIYGGFISSFGPTIIMLIMTSVLLYLWSYAILPLYIDKLKTSVRFKRKVIKLHRFWIGTRISLDIERKEKRRFNNIAFLLLASLAFILSLVYFENEGQKKAEKVISDHMAGENSSDSMITVIINENEKKLRFLGCGAKNCAGIEEKSNKIYYFSQDSGYSFIYKLDM